MGNGGYRPLAPGRHWVVPDDAGPALAQRVGWTVRHSRFAGFPGALTPKGVAAYPRCIAAMMTAAGHGREDLLAGMWPPQGVVVVLRRLLWDNESVVGQRGRLAKGWRMAGSCGATDPVDPDPFHTTPNPKGIVERLSGDAVLARAGFHVGGGLQRPAVGVAGCDRQRCIHATTGLIPADALAADLGAMPPCHRSLRQRGTVPLRRDYYVSCGGNA